MMQHPHGHTKILSVLAFLSQVSLAFNFTIFEGNAKTAQLADLVQAFGVVKSRKSAAGSHNRWIRLRLFVTCMSQQSTSDSSENLSPELYMQNRHL